ncbi:hypothetical protein FSARC_5922 [Fusarium sarcochroum]|uniref:Uncharacterized protein n=1 Tax=Fusarium sarcochroum TaxID=1208366 RepID=A0A8H4TYG3_9HYPO|nr:hypothetical protein FSARC_5922 [Fusarium sarcochroum]
MSDSRQNSGNDQHVLPELLPMDEFWRRCAPDVRATFARMGEMTSRFEDGPPRAEPASQADSQRGTTRRREDATESPRPRQVARTASPNRATPLDDAERNDLMQRISVLEASNAALAGQLDDTETETRRFLERAQALEAENLALKQQVRRLERQRD